MVLLGKIHSFNHNSDDTCEYIEWIDQYFFAKHIYDVKKKTAIFITVIWSETCCLFRNLLGHVSTSTKTVEKLFEILEIP